MNFKVHEFWGLPRAVPNYKAQLKRAYLNIAMMPILDNVRHDFGLKRDQIKYDPYTGEVELSLDTTIKYSSKSTLPKRSVEVDRMANEILSRIEKEIQCDDIEGYFKGFGDDIIWFVTENGYMDFIFGEFNDIPEHLEHLEHLKKNKLI
jgi:hypothetical protein